MTAQSDIETELFTLEFSETFWPSYPKKVARADALKAFIAIRKKSISLKEVMDGLACYRVECSRTDPKFIAHAGTWLRGCRFQDEARNEQSYSASPTLPHRSREQFNPKLYEHPEAAKPGTLRSVAEILAMRK